MFFYFVVVIDFHGLSAGAQVINSSRAITVDSFCGGFLLSSGCKIAFCKNSIACRYFYLNVSLPIFSLSVSLSTDLFEQHLRFVRLRAEAGCVGVNGTWPLTMSFATQLLFLRPLKERRVRAIHCICMKR